ncbi:MAG: glycosyltransferase, partial [Gemmatimonadota bacterium]|nr:glycosyltransferase [Gemmatimonadota bacterium]
DIALNRLAQSVEKASAEQDPGNATISSATDSSAKSAGKRIRDALRSLLYFPDAELGWYPFALAEGRRIIGEWRPDVIFVSAGPQTGLMVASKLSKEFGIPWVAELRDLWVDNHRYQHGAFRRSLESKLELSTLGSAAGFVTVSEPLAETLRAKYPQKTEVVYNGFDPDDYAREPGPAKSGKVRIVYTGWVYREHDAGLFFQALALLGDEARSVVAEFYRSDESRLRALAKRYGVEDSLVLKPEVSFQESQALQRGADVLLYFSWNDPTADGIFSGKLMQYFGARRPILAVGPADNAPAEVVRTRELGFASASAPQIAKRIGEWIDEKRAHGEIADTPAGKADEFSRENQTKKLEAFLREVTAR